MQIYLFIGQSRARWCSRSAWVSRQQGCKTKNAARHGGDIILNVMEKTEMNDDCMTKNEKMNVSSPRVEKVKQDFLGCQAQL